MLNMISYCIYKSIVVFMACVADLASFYQRLAVAMSYDLDLPCWKSVKIMGSRIFGIENRQLFTVHEVIHFFRGES